MGLIQLLNHRQDQQDKDTKAIVSAAEITAALSLNYITQGGVKLTQRNNLLINYGVKDKVRENNTI
jgi:hypothetical protein